jgi:hypothetical protein
MRTSHGIRLGVSLSLAACAATEPPPAPLDRAPATGVELATLEIRHDLVDRFEHCPPPGEIGQEWLPAIPDWHAPATLPSGQISEKSDGEGVTNAMAQADQIDADGARPGASQQELTDEAVAATRVAFRRCYHKGLLSDPTQDGHVAVVLRVGNTGQVAAVETWGACDLATDALICMRDEAAQVHLHPPIGGAATITLPAVFTNAAERERERNGAYAAAAYVAIEATRPRLHACEQAAKREGESVFASATMAIDIDAKGHGTHIKVDPWKGSQGLLGCAAQVLRSASFPPPPGHKGKVIVPVVFNPRPGTR